MNQKTEHELDIAITTAENQWKKYRRESQDANLKAGMAEQFYFELKNLKDKLESTI
jgi:hypothetical protein